MSAIVVQFDAIYCLACVRSMNAHRRLNELHKMRERKRKLTKIKRKNERMRREGERERERERRQRRESRFGWFD